MCDHKHIINIFFFVVGIGLDCPTDKDNKRRKSLNKKKKKFFLNDDSDIKLDQSWTEFSIIVLILLFLNMIQYGNI